MVKAIFFDIDGTLVSFKTHVVSDRVRASLKRLREKGMKLFIASGRPFVAIDNLRDLEFDGYITLNGAYSMAAENVVIDRAPIEQSDVAAMVDYLTHDASFPVVFVREHDCFANFLDEDALKVFKALNSRIETMGRILPLEHALEEEVYQMITFVKPEEEAPLFERLTHSQSARWSPYFTDIVRQGISKREGIDKMLAYYGLSLDETMAFGDGGNDLTMLKHVKIGVAMGNAKEEVKAVADYVTTSVDEDGISDALVHFGLL